MKNQNQQGFLIEKFNPSSFEIRWQETWRKEKVYQPNFESAKKPFYNLMMFPYPSAEGLHVGNMYAFTGADVYARFMRMQGYDVFEPIGLDGFGIHSENYALKIGKHPKEQASISEKNFYRQLGSIGNSFAWENRLETYDPDYYRWTQWLFIQLFKNGLAYRKSSPVNFCPSCKTVLSDEQVISGACERCGTTVEKREMEQWFFRITSYAERLLANTYREDFRWSEKVKIGQQHWIGRKDGIIITYQLDGMSAEISCFTTRPDTNYGATFVVIGPEHPFVSELLNSKFEIRNSKLKEIEAYVKKTKGVSEQDRIAQGRKKTGVFTGYHAINQLTGRKMPVYISDFVLGHVGTGAVVGVPGHDLRDFEFAQTFAIPIIRVVVGSDGDTSDIRNPEQVQEEEGTMIHSEFLDGKDIHEATKLMMDHLEKKGWGKRVTTYKLRDWCVSRQRYWGAPIPMIYCEACAKKGISHQRDQAESISSDMAGWFPVPESDLPVLLPDLDDWKPEGTGKGPLAKVASFVTVKCPQCGADAKRETDVCDTFLDSAWYFLRYPFVQNINSKFEIRLPAQAGNSKPQISQKNNASRHHLDQVPSLLQREGQGELVPWDGQIMKKWLPVNMYIGGAEHTVLHLLYARFVTMALKDFGYIDFEEPFSRFYAHGLIIKDGAKMSKSKGNIVNPDEYMKKYGADTLRTYLMFLGPFDGGGDFRDSGIVGMYKFLGRVWRMAHNVMGQEVGSSEKHASPVLDRAMHRAIKEVTEDIQALRYNTAIAHIMEYMNVLTSLESDRAHISKEHVQVILFLLAPFAPHMTEALFQQYCIASDSHGFSSIHKEQWPSYEESSLEEEQITIVAQVNGKVRDSFFVTANRAEDKEYIVSEALLLEKVKKFIGGFQVKRIIFVPKKLVNIVVV